FADGVLVRPETLRHCLVHNCDQRRLRIVGFAKSATAQNGDLHGLKVIRIDEIASDDGSLIAGYNRGFVAIDRHSSRVIPHGYAEREASSLNFRPCPNA